MTHLKPLFKKYGQEQVFRFYQELSPQQQDELSRQAEAIDLGEIERLVETLVRKKSAAANEQSSLSPAQYIPVSAKEQNPELWQDAKNRGVEALSKGRVAAFTVAGGQGTRLGFDGPKGTFSISPVSNASLFQVFAHKIAAAVKRYSCNIPWFIMTSEENHEETSTFFKRHSHFGLNPEHVHLFPQGTIPSVDNDGKILLSEKHRIAVSPDGHGGSLRALVRSGATQKMKDKGIDILSCFQVDNPMVKCIDPVFIGFHLLRDSQLSSKVVEKRHPDEKVGLFCKKNDTTCVIEYSDLPRELQHEAETDGALRFRAGSIAIHLFDRKLIEQLGDPESEASMPFHAAHKKVPALNQEGRSLDPSEPNASKFEMFIFDALPFAKNPVILETLREEEFSPVKNASGDDSPESSRRDQIKQFVTWFEAAGIEVPFTPDGKPIKLEISPQFADSKESFIVAWNALSNPPDLQDGLIL